MLGNTNITLAFEAMKSMTIDIMLATDININRSIRLWITYTQMTHHRPHTHIAHGLVATHCFVISLIFHFLFLFASWDRCFSLGGTAIEILIELPGV